jgi:hypothetical protein
MAGRVELWVDLGPSLIRNSPGVVERNLGQESEEVWQTEGSRGGTKSSLLGGLSLDQVRGGSRKIDAD